MRKDNINLSVSPPLGGRFTVELTRRAARRVFCFILPRAARAPPYSAMHARGVLARTLRTRRTRGISSRRTRGLRKHFNPSFPSAAAVSFRVASVLPTMMTRAPSSAKRRAIALPMPEPPPVTTAVLFSNLPINASSSLTSARRNREREKDTLSPRLSATYCSSVCFCRVSLSAPFRLP